MTSIQHITIEVADVPAAERFYSSAFDTGAFLQLRASDAPTSGFRGFHVSLTVAQPSSVTSLVASAVAAGATTLKPVAKSLWGVGGVVRAPDGTIWKVATSAKKDTGPATRDFDSMVLLLGAEDIVASKNFYAERGFAVDKSFGKTYVQFATPKHTVGFGLYRRSALAKDAGVPELGSGSHRIAIAGDAGSFTDPDGFAWHPAH